MRWHVDAMQRHGMPAPMTGKAIVEAWVSWQETNPDLRTLRMRPIKRRVPMFLFDEDWARLIALIDTALAAASAGRTPAEDAPSHAMAAPP